MKKKASFWLTRNPETVKKYTTTLELKTVIMKNDLNELKGR